MEQILCIVLGIFGAINVVFGATYYFSMKLHVRTRAASANQQLKPDISRTRSNQRYQKLLAKRAQEHNIDRKVEDYTWKA